MTNVQDGLVRTGQLTDGVVQILGPAGEIRGAGFVVSDAGLIATCAHVVGEAARDVTVAFHATGEATPRPTDRRHHRRPRRCRSSCPWSR